MTFQDLTLDEWMFFQEKPGALELYLALREKMEEAEIPVTIQVKKTQISLIHRHLFGAVSFLPVVKAKERPSPFLTLTFGLDHRLNSPRIQGAVEAYPNRWTHHMVIGRREELDGQVIDWLGEAARFAASKR